MRAGTGEAVVQRGLDPLVESMPSGEGALSGSLSSTVSTSISWRGLPGKVLEDANIKLGSVATDVLGVSGRSMLELLLLASRIRPNSQSMSAAECSR